MSDTKTFDINELSGHLFWDVNRDDLDMEKNFRFVLQRILTYGLMKDWILLYKSYGIEKIANETKKLRTLDDKSLHFIARISHSDLNEFRCYTTKQSNPKHWNF